MKRKRISHIFAFVLMILIGLMMIFRFLDGPFFRNDSVGNIQKTHAVAAGKHTVEKLCGYHDTAALCQVDM